MSNMIKNPAELLLRQSLNVMFYYSFNILLHRVVFTFFTMYLNKLSP
jgi:hypothetical protein